MTNGHFNKCITEENCWCEIKRYWTIFGISITVFVLEVFGGAVSQSLALLADAGHVLTDTSAVIVSIIVTYRVKRYPESANKVRAMGGYINVALLGLVAFSVGIEAIERFQNPQNTDWNIMIPFAIFGIVGNYLQHYLLKNVDESHITHESMYSHVLSDLITSAGVILGGVLIAITEWILVDPIISMAISVIIFRLTYKLYVKTTAVRRH